MNFLDWLRSPGTQFLQFNKRIGKPPTPTNAWTVFTGEDDNFYAWNGTQLIALNLAGGLTPPIPVADLTAGANGQFLKTVGTAVEWDFGPYQIVRVDSSATPVTGEIFTTWHDLNIYAQEVVSPLIIIQDGPPITAEVEDYAFPLGSLLKGHNLQSQVTFLAGTTITGLTNFNNINIGFATNGGTDFDTPCITVSESLYCQFGVFFLDQSNTPTKAPIVITGPKNISALNNWTLQNDNTHPIIKAVAATDGGMYVSGDISVINPNSIEVDATSNWGLAIEPLSQVSFTQIVDAGGVLGFLFFNPTLTLGIGNASAIGDVPTGGAILFFDGANLNHLSKKIGSTVTDLESGGGLPSGTVGQILMMIGNPTPVPTWILPAFFNNPIKVATSLSGLRVSWNMAQQGGLSVYSIQESTDNGVNWLQVGSAPFNGASLLYQVDISDPGVPALYRIQAIASDGISIVASSDVISFP